MKKVGIREAQVNLTTLLKEELPFVITRYGRDIAYVGDPVKLDIAGNRSKPKRKR